MRYQRSHFKKSRMNWFFGLGFFIALQGCSHTDLNRGNEDINTSQHEAKSRDSSTDLHNLDDVSKNQNSANSEQTGILDAGDKGNTTFSDANCIALPEGHIEGQPIVVETGQVVVTRFMKSCITRDGQSGVIYNSPYTAMGVPCAGGVGQVDWKGYYSNPKVVQLTFSNDCQMTSLKEPEIQNHVMEVLNLQTSNQMVALNPLAVQFWELPEGMDADVGYHLTLRSNRSKQVLWPLMRKGDPVEVRLYGRENSWGSSNQFYKVEGVVRLSGTAKFQFELSKITPLTDEQLVELKNLCFSLEPKRDCSKVFGY